MDNGLKWGKPTIEIGLIGANGAAPTDWIKLDIPVENSTKLTSAKGDKKEAKEEGGGVVAVRYGENNYTLEFELYAKGDNEKPIPEVNGVITQEYAVRITPENASLPGKQLDLVHFSIEDTFDAENGEKWKYTGDVLKPTLGNKIKPYSANGLAVTPSALYFGNTADSTGKPVTVTSTANPTATSSESWCTVTTAAKVVTVKVAANSGAEARTAAITITADSKTSKVAVMQIPA